jgi:membrane fusion protein (multidrug efflux system)
MIKTYKNQKLITAAIFGALMVMSCQNGSRDHKDPEKGDKSAQDDAVFVETVGLRQAPVSETLQASGVIYPKRQINLMSARPGRIIRVTVEEGDLVNKGQLLGVLDNERETIVVNRVLLQLEKLKQQKKRVEQLVQEKIQPQETLDNLNFTLQEAQLSLADAKKNLRETRLTAPFKATITRRFWEKGATAMQGSAAFVLIDASALEVRLGIPEDRLGSIKKGQEVDVYPLAAPSQSFAGHVLRIHPTVDPQSGTVQVVIELKPNAFLKSGMFVRAKIHTNHKAMAMLAPKKALLYEDEQTFLFRLTKSDGKMAAQKVAVKTGMNDGDHVEIHSELTLEDQIIVQGQSGLKDGTMVRTTIEKPKPKPDKTKDKKKKRHSARHRP